MAEVLDVNTQQILQYYHQDHLTMQSIKRRIPGISIEAIANALATPTIEEQLDSLMAELSTDLQVAYIKKYLRSNVTAWEDVVSEGLGKLPRNDNLLVVKGSNGVEQHWYRFPTTQLSNLGWERFRDNFPLSLIDRCFTNIGGSLGNGVYLILRHLYKTYDAILMNALTLVGLSTSRKLDPYQTLGLQCYAELSHSQRRKIHTYCLVHLNYSFFSSNHSVENVRDEYGNHLISRTFEDVQFYYVSLYECVENYFKRMLESNPQSILGRNAGELKDAILLNLYVDKGGSSVKSNLIINGREEDCHDFTFPVARFE